VPTAQLALILAVLLLFLMSAWLIIATGLGYVARTLVSRWNATRLATGVRFTIALVAVPLGWLGALFSIALSAAFANAEAASKATMLARGLLEALTCKPYAAIVALTIAGAFSLIWRLARRARDPSAHV
jgi:hypothetical protein